MTAALSHGGRATNLLRLVLLSLITGHPVAGDERPADPLFIGMCDASAAVAIGPDRFVVADDEDNILRIYSRNGGEPIVERDLSEFLGNTGPKKGKEADLEAAAQIGGRTFWITSHGRNARGKESPERQRLFATELRAAPDNLVIDPVGKPYTRLLEEIAADERFARFHLAEAATLPPKAAGGLNVEGLTATPGNHLLIGFRNPVPNGKSLIIPLLNPNEILTGSSARFGDPIELDLLGLGIRSIGFHAGRYWILAGSFDDSGRHRMFEWNGKDQPRQVESVSFAGLNPEGVVFPGKDDAVEYLVLSDDGSSDIDGRDCKKLKDPSQKRFRGKVVKF